LQLRNKPNARHETLASTLSDRNVLRVEALGACVAVIVAMQLVMAIIVAVAWEG
jgi:hypothetical protein